MTTPLPQDLITEILLRLQVKPLLRFQCVSKPLFALINGPYFINMHLRCSIENTREHTLIAETTPYSNMAKDLCILNFSDIPNILDDDLSIQTFLNIPVDWVEPVKIFRPFYLLTETTIATTIVGCCNGLVCLHTFPVCLPTFPWDGLFRKVDPSETVIWNPLIRKYKKLPFKPIENSDDFDLELAFGYDHINDDYKVLRILKYGKRPDDFPVLRVDHVYSLRTHSCRMVEDQWPYKELSSFICSGPASSNGALHWVVRWEGQSTKTIVAFDLATEKFRVHALPCRLLHSNICLEVVKGCQWLCVCGDGYCQFNQIWLEYEVASNRTLVEWLAFYYKPVVFSKGDKEVLMKGSFRRLFWDDIKFSKLPRLHCFKKFTLLVGSLLLLDGESDH